jgi:hypothetical protein
VFSIGLRDLVDHRDLESIAEPVGWQFLVRRRGEPMAIEVSDRSLDVQTETGPQIQGASEFFSTDNPTVTSASESTARLLRVPEVGLMAVWILSSHDDELIVPLDPAPRSMQPLERYHVPEFLEQAAAIAQRRLEGYAELGGGEKGGS